MENLKFEIWNLKFEIWNLLLNYKIPISARMENLKFTFKRNLYSKHQEQKLGFECIALYFNKKRVDFL